MATPTVNSSGNLGAWLTTQPKTATVTTLAGDLLVAMFIGSEYSTASDEPATPTYTNSPTFTARISSPSLLTLNSYIRIWTAPITTNTTSGTLSIAMTTTPRWGGAWAVVRGAGGTVAFDACTQTNGAVGISHAHTSVAANCLALAAWGDWDATDGDTTRVYRTVNSITPVRSGAGEIVYNRVAGEYTAYSAFWTDVGAAGAQTYGITTPSTGTKWYGAVITITESGGGSNFTAGETASAGLTDARVLDVGTVRTDSSGLTDVRVLDLGTVRTDSSGLTDSALVESGKLLSADDVTGLTDARAMDIGTVRTDTSGLTDTRLIDLGTARTDTSGLTDTATVAMDRPLSATDSAGLTDAAVRVLAAARSVVDGAGLTDSYVIEGGSPAVAYTPGARFRTDRAHSSSLTIERSSSAGTVTRTGSMLAARTDVE